MIKKKNVLFFGSSGGCLDAFYLFDECFNNKRYQKFILSDSLIKNSFFLRSKVLGGFNYIFKNKFNETFFIYQCGNFENSHLRDDWFLKAKKNNLTPMTLISPLAYVHKTAKVSEGCIIYPGVKIMRNVYVGKNCIILPNSIINHDTIIGDYTIINSSVIINGEVGIGKKNYIGAGSIIREKINTKDFIKIGMGSMVTKNLEDIGIYYGSPATKKHAYNWSGQ